MSTVQEINKRAMACTKGSNVNWNFQEKPVDVLDRVMATSHPLNLEEGPTADVVIRDAIRPYAGRNASIWVEMSDIEENIHAVGLAPENTDHVMVFYGSRSPFVANVFFKILNDAKIRVTRYSNPDRPIPGDTAGSVVNCRFASWNAKGKTWCKTPLHLILGCEKHADPPSFDWRSESWEHVVHVARSAKKMLLICEQMQFEPPRLSGPAHQFLVVEDRKFIQSNKELRARLGVALPAVTHGRYQQGPPAMLTTPPPARLPEGFVREMESIANAPSDGGSEPEPASETSSSSSKKWIVVGEKRVAYRHDPYVA